VRFPLCNTAGGRVAAEGVGSPRRHQPSGRPRTKKQQQKDRHQTHSCPNALPPPPSTAPRPTYLALAARCVRRNHRLARVGHAVCFGARAVAQRLGGRRVLAHAGAVREAADHVVKEAGAGFGHGSGGGRGKGRRAVGQEHRVGKTGVAAMVGGPWRPSSSVMGAGGGLIGSGVELTK